MLFHLVYILLLVFKTLPPKKYLYLHIQKESFAVHPGYIHTTHAMAAVKFLQEDYGASEKYMEQSYQFLDQNKHENWFDVMDLTWPLILWSNAQISPKHSAVDAYFSELMSRRNKDGIWTSIYPNCDAQYTIEAISLLQNYRI